MPFHRILCPLDLDKPTERRVFDYAADLAAALKASLHVLHVYDLPGYVHPRIHSDAAKRYEERALRHARKKLDELLEARDDVSVTGELHPGVPHRRIGDEVARLAIDLIVMGTHARGAVEHFFLGSIAERTLRTAAVPVIAVPYTRDPPPSPPRAILVPDDFSAGSRKALELARELHKSLHAAVAAVHVLPADISEDASASFIEAPERERLRDALERELERDIDEVFGPDAQVVARRMADGPVVEEVLAAAGELDTELLVVGASGKSGIERMLLGSVTVGLVRASPIPVLTVR